MFIARDGRIRHSKGSKDSALMSLIEASAPTNEHVPEWSYKHVSRSQRSHGSFDSTSSTNRVSPALSAVPDYLATSAPANGGSLFYFNESPSKKATQAPIPRHRKTGLILLDLIFECRFKICPECSFIRSIENVVQDDSNVLSRRSLF